MRKDIALDENGATVQRTGDDVDGNARMNWSIYEHDKKGNLKRKGPSFPITRGDNVTEQFNKQFLDRD